MRGDVILIKGDLSLWMRWRKGKDINVITGRDNLIKEVKLEQLNLNETVKINRPLQHIAPFEITEKKQTLKPITKLDLSELLQQMQISKGDRRRPL